MDLLEQFLGSGTAKEDESTSTTDILDMPSTSQASPEVQDLLSILQSLPTRDPVMLLQRLAEDTNTSLTYIYRGKLCSERQVIYHCEVKFLDLAVTGSGFTPEESRIMAAEKMIETIPGFSALQRSSNSVRTLKRIAFDLRMDVEFTITHVTEVAGRTDYRFMVVFGHTSAEGQGTTKERGRRAAASEMLQIIAKQKKTDN